MESLPPTLSVRIAATFTAEPVEPVLSTWLDKSGLPADVQFAPFNQVHRQLLDPGSLLAGNRDGVNVVLVRPGDIGVDTASRARAAAREVAAALGEAVSRDGIPTLVMACPVEEIGDAETVFAADLADQLHGVSGVEVLDARKMQRLYPVVDGFDPDADESARVPYREAMFVALGSFLARRITALRRKPYKVIAVDCDNTLWSGICGESGSRGVVVDAPRKAFQRFLMARRAEGYLLCMVSKNNDADVEAVFRENPEMVIPRDAFVDAAINWEPKSGNLVALAQRLSLGLDSFLFLDDNPAEIAEVEANSPAVLSLRLPDDPAELPLFIDHLWVLDRAGQSVEDAKRADFYHDEARRREMRERATSFTDFIESLQLEVSIESADTSDVSRISQLTQRTNQFNACPQPRDEAAMLEACRGMRPEVVNVRDRFGDYGTVGLMLTREDGGRLWAETFLLSCRALGKGVEHRMLRHLGRRAMKLGLGEVAIWFQETERNQPCHDFLDSVGDGSWEDGLWVIPAGQAASCLLQPVVSKNDGKAGVASIPLADPALASRIAHELRTVDAIREWAAPEVRPRPDLGEQFASPQGEAEETIAKIWSQVLGIEKIGRNDRFVDLGGDSLQLVRVHAKIQRAFDYHFELVRLFEHPTVTAQALLVGTEEESAREAVVVESPDRDADQDADDGAIAIVGMGLRLPGASTPEELWENLRNGVDAITRFDAAELDVPGREGEELVCARGLLEPEVFEGLDGGLFGIVPREAEMIDPQHRVFLEICWEALERAGYVPDDAEVDGGRVGVYAGSYYGTYLPHNVLSDPEMHLRHLREAQVGALQVEFGNDKDHLATRVAFKLNLKGPSLTVQTACSTSMVAVAHAVMALRSGHCEMALAGGVTVTVPQKRGFKHVEGGMLSRDGYCRPFDADSCGTVFSNGAGVVLLKKLTAAKRDGDHIHAVLRGYGINNDGGVKHSYAAPSPDGQTDVIRRAHEDAGVDPRTITYVEAHGTATPLGDPIEIAGLTAAFRKATDDRGFCAIGSLKSNIGHLDTAAGVCGLIKTALSLEHGELPALLHFSKPNPRIDFASTPFFVNDKLRPWEPADGVPRRAGVSSFGVGGTNVHVVLEEAPAEQVVTESDPVGRVIVMSGRTDEALAQMAGKLADHAEAANGSSFAAAARTLAVGRKAMPRRAVVVASDWKAAAEQLRDGKWARAEAGAEAPGMVWMFPGQGAQHPGMTAELYASEAGYREDIDRCAEILLPELGEDLREILFAANDEAAAERIKHTVLAQLSIFVVEYSLARQWMRWGLKPEMMLGHSVGEFTAACLADVVPLDGALRILAARGRLMGGLPGGSMLSVRMGSEDLRERLPEHLDLAAENGPALCVVAGETELVAEFGRELRDDGVAVRELHTSHAFHSRMVDPAVEQFGEVIAGTDLKAPRIPILSTVTNRLLSEVEATDPGYWAAHMRRTVRFHGALEKAAEENDGRVYLEVGPGQTLTTLARQTVGRRSAGCLPSCEHPASEASDRARMLLTLGELWCRGLEVDWNAVHAGVPKQRVPLPTYPFQRRRHWLPCRLLDEGRKVVEIDAAVCEAADRRETPHEDSPQPEAAAPQPDAAGGLIYRVRQVLEDLSGIPGEEMAENAGFLEMGFDSLLLTQAARQIEKTFGVAVTFRDLMQAVPTVGALVSHLQQNGVAAPAPAVVTEKPAAPVQAAAAPAQPVAAPSEVEPESGVAGPRTRIDRSAAGEELTARQRKHLDELIATYNAKTPRSKELTQQHRQWHADPRTVNGFNRRYKEMIYQIVAERMKGCRMWDVDGNEYVDMVNGFGPNFLGHSPDFITEAIQEQLATGPEIGPQCLAAMETSKLFCEVTGNERVCFLNTGSEAVQAAMRISRTVTGRDKIVVFDKDYHGNFDSVLVRSVGKGAKRRTLPMAPGIPDSAVNDIIVVPWGRPEALDMIREVAGELAAVLVEPVQSRQPELVPIDFVREVKKISEENGFLMVFDEVITGLRQGPRGAQEIYGIRADLATYGKVFGGGALPIGIVAGKAEYMDTFDGGHWQYGDDSFPEKEVTFFAGTFVRLPLAMAACRAVLTHLKDQGPEYWQAIGDKADRLARTVDRMFRDNGIDVRMVNHGSQMHLRIGDEAVHGKLIYYHLRSKGVFAMEGVPFYLTAAHTDADVDFVIEAFRRSIAELQDGGFFPKPELPEIAELPAGVRGPFPMTEPMVEVHLGSLLGREANLAFNELMQMRLEGPIDMSCLRAAIQDIVNRHDALRMRVPDERGVAFVIDTERQALIIEEDLRHDADPEASLAELSRRELETEFDLFRGPLFRVVVARVADDHVALQFVAHHLAVDGPSFDVFALDFAKFYEARREGRRPTLLPAPSIVDRAMQRAASDGRDDVALAWWRERFADGVPELELPLRRGYGVEPSYASATCQLILDSETLERVRKLAAGCRATLSSTLLGAFHALLHRMSGQERFVHAFPVAGQMEGIDDQLVGHCVNFLPLIAEVDPGQSFKELVARSSTAQLDAVESGKVTYGRLLRDLKFGRDGGRRPLSEVIFNLEPSGDPGGFGGLSTKVENVLRRYSNATMMLHPMRMPDSLLLSITYNRDLLDEGTVAHWLKAYRNLLLEAAKAPETAVGDLTLLDGESRLELAGWSGSDELVDTRSVGEVFRETCEIHASRTAISCAGGSCSYAELGERVAGFAAALRNAGVRPGDRVGISLPRSADLIAALLGVLEAGASYVPMEPEFPVARRREILVDSGARVLISVDEPLPGLDLTVLHPDTVGPAAPELVSRGPDDPAYVMYTSGSTGKPKGVVVPHRGIVRLVKGADYCEFGPDEVIVQASTAAFDAATFEIYGALLNGGRLVLVEKGSTLDAIANVVREQGVTSMFLTSGLFELMVDERLDDLQGVRQLLTGGEAFSLSHMRRAFEGLPNTRLIHCYGPTENTTFTTCHTVCEKDFESGLIPIGGPIAGTQVRIVDTRGREVPVGVPGELQCGGPGLALGYLGRTAMTKERFIENGSWYRTGDICRWSADGLVEFVGRIDEQVKLRGFRIELGEVEATLAKHPAVQRCKVAVRGSGSAGKRMLAWYSPADGAAADSEEIRTWLSTQLPAFMQPDGITAVDELPLNRNGKVDVAALPEPRAAGRNAAKAPSGPVEQKLAMIWRDILNVDEIGRDDEFFELGGNSLGGLQLFSRIHREFNVSLPLSTLLQARSISALAAAVKAGANGSGLSMTSPAPVRKVSSLQESWLATVRDGGDLPPVLGIHGGDGGILFYRELANRMPNDRPFMAIESPELSNNDEIVVASVEATASKYVEMVKDFRPEGPYLLAGYSFGGVVAYEMARQLVNAGEEVPYLVLFDTENPAIERKQYSLAERLSVFWNSSNDLPLLKRFKSLATRVRDGVETNLRVKAEIADAQRSDAAEAHSELRCIQLREAHYRAMLAYQPNPYSGALTLFRADSVNDKFETPADYGWSSLVGEIRIVDVPGEHLTMFSEKNVESLARKFTARLPQNREVRRALAPASACGP